MIVAVAGPAAYETVAGTSEPEASRSCTVVVLTVEADIAWLKAARIAGAAFTFVASFAGVVDTTAGAAATGVAMSSWICDAESARS